MPEPLECHIPFLELSRLPRRLGGGSKATKNPWQITRTPSGFGIDACGFIFASALEYGTDAVEIHTDALDPGQKILIVDDVLATGGTIAATVELIQNNSVHALIALSPARTGTPSAFAIAPPESESRVKLSRSACWKYFRFRTGSPLMPTTSNRELSPFFT